MQIVRDGGSVLAAAINATSLALIDAGIGSTSILSAVAVCSKELEGADGSNKDVRPTLQLDPVEEEVNSSQATATFAFASNTAGAILSVIEAGTMDQQTYFEAIQIGRAACAHVQQYMKIALERRTASTTSQ